MVSKSLAVGKYAYLKGCKQKMKIESLDNKTGMVLCSWVDPNTPNIHKKTFNLADLKPARMSINMNDIENAFAKM